MRTVVVKAKYSDEETDAFAGELLGEDSYDELFTDSVTVVTEDGKVLAKLIKNAVPLPVAKAAYGVLREAATPTTNRGIATGKDVPKGPRVKKDGTVSKTSAVPAKYAIRSGIIGYFDRYPRIPYCRQTAFNMNQPEKFMKALPFIQAADKVFKEHMPERWEAQKAVCDATEQSWIIPNTSFTTITVNKNWQTAVHKDVGDLKQGFGVMAILRAGEYTGGCFVFPKYRVAFDYRSGDIMLADVHEWHGNTPIIGKGLFERVTCVFYYREKMKDCGTPAEELDRAKNLNVPEPEWDGEGFQATTTKKGV